MDKDDQLILHLVFQVITREKQKLILKIKICCKKFTLIICPCLIAGEPSANGGMVNLHTPHSSRANGYCLSCQLSMEKKTKDKNKGRDFL
jgi:hypothetical protein